MQDQRSLKRTYQKRVGTYSMPNLSRFGNFSVDHQLLCIDFLHASADVSCSGRAADLGCLPVVLMLRASSLGLSLFSPPIVIVQTCRRLKAPKTFLIQKHSLTTTPTGEPAVLSRASRRVRPHRVTESGEKLHASESSANGSPTAPDVGLLDKEGFPAVPTVNVGRGSAPPNKEEATEVMRNFMLDEDIDRLLSTGMEVQEPKHQTVTDAPPFAAGRAWRKKEIKPLVFGLLSNHLRLIKEDIFQEYRNYGITNWGAAAHSDTVLPPRYLPLILKDHFLVLNNTQDVEEAWHAYISLIDYITRIPSVYQHIPFIPFAQLHRLARLLASNRPKTHRQYLRLLAVMTYLKHSGGTILQHEYNALVDLAGQGWRKTREEEINHSRRVAMDLQMGRLPGSSDEVYDLESDDYAGLTPDIYTYTTLLAIAARALSTKELLNITSLMQRAGLPPNRITHLSLLRYFTQKKDLGGVRSTLRKMRAQNLELGLDGLNACMWAYGRNNRVDVALMVYRLLRHNVDPESYTGPGDVRETVSQLAEEYIFVEPDMWPNEITYTMLMQMMAYLGHFQGVLDIFRDMLTFENKELGAPLHADDKGGMKPTNYTPTVAVYRTIFLGFSRHGVPPAKVTASNANGWTLENLGNLFERFLCLPQGTVITYANVDIIMKAFLVTSGDNAELMRDIWLAIEGAFGPVVFKPNSANRLIRLKMRLFPEQFQGQ